MCTEALFTGLQRSVFEMAEHYKSCREFISSSTENLPVFMFEGDYERINNWVLEYPRLETGGDLFGLWTGDLNPLIHIVLGPGRGCRRTEYSFFQDVAYLKEAGNAITDALLGHIGEWHSHHCMSLVEPSMGDYSTVRRNYPRGFHGFLLMIANIVSGRVVSLSPYLFRETGKVEKGRIVLLAGESPFRKQSRIKCAAESGAEGGTIMRQGVERVNRARNARVTVESSGAQAGPMNSITLYQSTTSADGQGKPPQRGNGAEGRTDETQHGKRRNRAHKGKVTVVEVSQSRNSANMAATPPVGQPQPTTNARGPEHQDTRTAEAAKPSEPAQQGTRSLPDKPQWHAADDGKCELQSVSKSFQRLQGTGHVEQYFDPNGNACFKFNRKKFEWVVTFPPKYPHGPILLEHRSRAEKEPVTEAIQGNGEKCIMTDIITFISKHN